MTGMSTSGQRDRSGAVLLVVVLSMVAAGVVGVAMLSMATSARYEQLHVGLADRAYYLAESGAQYVRAVRRTDPTLFPQGTYTLENGDQFDVVTMSNAHRILVRSVGVVNPGTHLEARRQMHFDINERRIAEETLPIGFDFDQDGQFDSDMWTAVNLAPTIRDTGPSGGQPALDLKGEAGQIYLNWQNYPEMDLAYAWLASGRLLEYDVQLKIQPFETGNQSAFSDHYMLGISFRLHPDTNHCYGLSYFRSRTDFSGPAPTWVRSLPPAIQHLRGTNLYLVLWYQNGGQFELLNYRRLGTADGVILLRNGEQELRDYSTLLVEVRERYRSGDARENMIAGYIASTNHYPVWPGGGGSNVVWQDDASVFPAPVVWWNGVVTNIDDRITSANFDQIKPAEVGVHVYYDQAGANKKFFDDFAMRLPGFDRFQGGTQVQY
jgi:hypothetical protein